MSRKMTAEETDQGAPSRAPNISGERQIVGAADSGEHEGRHHNSLPGRYQRSAADGVIDNRYALGRLIGEGATGKVYHCRHLRLRRQLAIKVLRRQFAFDRELTELFLNEAAAASAIDSINVVQVRDCGILQDGRPYLVMDFLEGESLYERLAQEPQPALEVVLDIFRQLCNGLLAAHAAGVVHRDLKPENIHLCPSDDQGVVVKLLDFGVAKIVDAASSVTRSGALFGTPQYMSPEQSRGAAVDARADIYAAGVLLYEMLTGRLPFDGETTLEVLTKQRYQPAAPPRQMRGMQSRVSIDLEQLLLRCLAKEPGNRFQGVSELLKSLDQSELCTQRPKKALTPPRNRRQLPAPAGPSRHWRKLCA